MKFLMFREIGIIKFEKIRKIILVYFNSNIRINHQRVLEDNIEIYNLEQFCDAPNPGGPLTTRQPVKTCVSHILRFIHE